VIERWDSQEQCLLNDSNDCTQYFTISRSWASAFVDVTFAFPCGGCVSWRLLVLCKPRLIPIGKPFHRAGVKAIKLYAWEEPYMKRLREVRRDERLAIRKAQLIGTINTVTFNGGPILVAIAAFWTYTSLGHVITADVAFPALAYFDLLRFPIIMLPMQVMNFINARVALRRLQSFLNAEEVPSIPLSPAATQPNEVAVKIEMGSFAWDPLTDAIIRDISLSIPAGRLVIVVGPVGCGKSSLLSALLHEMPAICGSVSVRGRIAYTAQDPWIQNKTVEGNVLMGMPMDRQRYEQVIEACALQSDLAMLPSGDQTEIGEKGVNLSGGQKHRIALARACYANADVYLLDDPLSAVDAHVGQHLMSRCMLHLLKAKTRILVTHQIQFLPEADEIIMMADGTITKQGTYQELIDQGVAFQQVQVSYDAEHQQDADHVSNTTGGQKSDDALGKSEASDHSNGERRSTSGTNVSMPQKAVDAKATGGELTGQEDRSKGSVSRQVYWTYLRAWGPGLMMPIAFITLAYSERGFQVMQNFWLSIWSQKTTAFEKDIAAGHAEVGTFPSRFYMLIYFSFGITSLVLQVVRAVVLVLSTVTASQTLHDNLVAKLLSLPMSFFDTQPSGRIINRFTKDVEACDLSLQQTISSFAVCVTSVTLAILVVAAVTRGVIVLAMLPLGFFYLVVQRYFIATSRELKRLDSIAVSPIFSSFAETLAGLTTIRAFGRQPILAQCNEACMDASSRAWWPIQVVNRWLSIRLEFIGQGLVLGTTVFVTLFIKDAGMAGLAITSSLSLVGIMNWATRQTTELEMGMNSVERLLEYLAHQSEAPAVIPGRRPPLAWPAAGEIHVTDLVLRYRPDLPPVIKGISFKINRHEKVGICGRTGCGKSTLMLALYRIVEPSGSIKIDGIEVTQIGLYDLRSRLSLIPQDPVIFRGTVRSNLWPFEDILDSRLWQALQQAGLEATVRGFERGLDAPLEEGGTNLSVGQRQLLCMARALLKKSVVLLMDEATSNVDNETDALIQSTVRSAFAECTVLTIAHRLHTIIDSDKILMMDKGEVVEFASPKELLKRPGSAFRRLVKEASGSVSSGALHVSHSAGNLAEKMPGDRPSS
jgi:ABC-type multidrug transport system fused ATPase/permease subunit